MAIQFWKDKSKRIINPDLFSSFADKLAQQVFNEQNKTVNKPVNKPTQIRKFYDEVLRFDSIIKLNPNEFENVLPYLKMLNAKAAYAMGRDLISKSFKDFISDALNQIKDKDDFSAFAGLFEAFMGYYKFYYDEKGERQQRGGSR